MTHADVGTPTRVSANEAVVLGMLARRPASVGSLVRRIGRTVGYFWMPARSHVYGLLPGLVASGLATQRREDDGDGLERSVYETTPSGRAAVVEWLSTSEFKVRPARNPFLVKVFFGGLLERRDVIEHVRAGRATLAAEIEELERIERDVDRAADPFGWLALRYGLERDQATLRWADQALAELEADGA